MRSKIRFFLTLAVLVHAVCAVAQTSPWSSGAYVYDGAGNIKRIGADYYIYDMAGRLIQGSADKERTGANSYQLYTYDTYGNRTTASTFGVGCIGGCGAFLDINELNHIRTTSHGASYDGGGNLTQFDNYQYSYDAVQMMSRIRLPNTTLDNQYIYTADDQRLATFIAPGQWRFTVRDLDGKILREVTASEGSPALWSWDRDHVFRDGLLMATVLPSNLTQHYHLDHLGTPKLVTGNGGVKLGVHAYYPFGEELSLGLSEVATERLKFTGHERDINGPYNNALDYMHARYYSPSAGAFLSFDPGLDIEKAQRAPQRWNRYAYVNNNPLVGTDPTGKIQFDKDGNVIFIKLKHMTIPFQENKDLGNGFKRTVTWEADVGYVLTDDGHKVLAAKATSDMHITVSDSAGNVVYDGGKDKYFPPNYNNTTDCHGQTFAKGQVWINNDQVPTIIAGDGYVPTQNPGLGDVGVYSIGGRLKDTVHSVTVSEMACGSPSGVASKGGITPFQITAPGPGEGTGWYDPNVTLTYYTQKQKDQ